MCTHSTRLPPGISIRRPRTSCCSIFCRPYREQTKAGTLNKSLAITAKLCNLLLLNPRARKSCAGRLNIGAHKNSYAVRERETWPGARACSFTHAFSIRRGLRTSEVFHFRHDIVIKNSDVIRELEPGARGSCSSQRCLAPHSTCLTRRSRAPAGILP